MKTLWISALLLLPLLDKFVFGDSVSGKEKYTGPRCGVESVESALPFCFPASYEMHVRPSTNKTVVYTRFRINDVEEINDKALSMTIHMHVEVRWEDDRIKLTKAWNQPGHNKTYHRIAQEMVDNFWLPDVSIYNLKEFKYIEVLRKQATLKIYQNKTLSYQVNSRVTVGCHFQFTTYPLDRQECHFEVGSYGHTADEMEFRGSFYHPKHRQRQLQMAIELHDLDDSNMIYEQRDKQGNVEGEYSVTGFVVEMKRSFDGYLFRTYLPAAFTTIVSWASFFIEQKEVAARLGLLVTLILVQVNILNANSESAPAAYSTNAVENYVLGCLCCVCLALLEFALVVYKKSPMESKRKEKLDHHEKSSGKDDPGKRAEAKEKEKEEEDEARGKDENVGTIIKQWFQTRYIDVCSACLFPTLFLGFNIAYWLYYASV